MSPMRDRKVRYEARSRPATPYYVTAKGYRALGYPIPARIADDAVVDLTEEENDVA